MSNIATYVRPNTKMTAKWSEVPQDIKDTFERLGIPQAERKSLAGVGAQYAPSWFTTMFVKKWKSRALYTPIWKAP